MHHYNIKSNIRFNTFVTNVPMEMKSRKNRTWRLRVVNNTSFLLLHGAGDGGFEQTLSSQKDGDGGSEKKIIVTAFSNFI